VNLTCLASHALVLQPPTARRPSTTPTTTTSRRLPVVAVATPRLGPTPRWTAKNTVVVPRWTNASLPTLSVDEDLALKMTGSVERQRRRGRVGEAMIVVDSPLPPSEIWASLNDVESWSRLMRGVRSSAVRERRRRRVRAAFHVTKLRLPANIVLEAPGPLDDTNTGALPFYLDTSCTNIAVDSLDGFWYVEPSPADGAVTRVWLCASVGACAIVPDVAVDYVAKKGLRRATEWLAADGRRP